MSTECRLPVDDAAAAVEFFLVFFDGANLGGGIRSASKREAAAMFCVEPTAAFPSRR